MTKQTKHSDLSLEQLEKVSGGGDAVPTETFSLNYEEIKRTYNQDSKHDQWIDILSMSKGSHKP